MPIVNSYQAAPTAVADFAQETGYLQEKARQVATQKAYNNHLAEINLQYQNQSDLSRQAAIQRAALTKQENDFREEYAQKSYQRNLKAMAANLEMRGDYQSRIMAEQFHNQADSMLAQEKVRKEARGGTYSPSAQRKQMEIKQQIQTIQGDTSTSMRDKLPEIRSLQRQLETMPPDQEPKNYVAPNSEVKDKDGNVWAVDSSGKQYIKTYADGTTESQHAAIQKTKEIDRRAANELRKIQAQNNNKIAIEQMRIDAQNRTKETQQQKASVMKQKSIELRAKSGDKSALDDVEIAAARGEPWAIDWMRQQVKEINGT